METTQPSIKHLKDLLKEAYNEIYQEGKFEDQWHKVIESFTQKMRDSCKDMETPAPPDTKNDKEECWYDISQLKSSTSPMIYHQKLANTSSEKAKKMIRMRHNIANLFLFVYHRENLHEHPELRDSLLKRVENDPALIPEIVSQIKKECEKT